MLLKLMSKQTKNKVERCRWIVPENIKSRQLENVKNVPTPTQLEKHVLLGQKE